ncbi:hypothetical protein ACWDR1_03650 [Streptosporangium sandarakinum]
MRRADAGERAEGDLREVLGVLRAQDPVRDPHPTPADLDRLLDQTRALGIAVNRHDEGEARPLGPTAERTACRVVQEALTNVHRHAGDVETDVFVRYLPAELEVVVRNGPSAETDRGGLRQRTGRPGRGVSGARRRRRGSRGEAR